MSSKSRLTCSLSAFWLRSSIFSNLCSSCKQFLSFFEHCSFTFSNLWWIFSTSVESSFFRIISNAFPTSDLKTYTCLRAYLISFSPFLFPSSKTRLKSMIYWLFFIILFSFSKVFVSCFSDWSFSPYICFEHKSSCSWSRAMFSFESFNIYLKYRIVCWLVYFMRSYWFLNI